MFALIDVLRRAPSLRRIDASDNVIDIESQQQGVAALAASIASTQDSRLTEVRIDEFDVPVRKLHSLFLPPRVQGKAVPVATLKLRASKA